MEKIKILQVCGGLSPEGIGVFLLNTVEHIDQDKFEVSFALATKYSQQYEDRIKQAGGKIYRTYEIGDGFSGKIKHFFQLVKIIRDKGPFDVVHSHMDFFNGVNLLAGYIGGIRHRISHAHVSAKPSFSLIESLYYFFMRALIRIFSTERLGCSEMANANINNEGVTLLNGINKVKFSKNNSFPDDIPLSAQSINLVTVGRMDSQKNPFFILNIIKELSVYMENFHFYWIGTGSLEKDILESATKLKLVDNITFLKNRDDVNRILPSMDIFIFPSLYEGLGIVLIEAQLCGVPCIVSSNIPAEVDLGLCEFLDLHPGTSYWANFIINFLKKPNHIRKINTEKLEEFDVSFMVRRLEKFYQGS